MWFGLNENILEHYGPHIHKVRVKRDLKLVNIMSWNFRIDFMDRLYKHFQGEDIESVELRRMKAMCIIALGIPNLDTQYAMMKKYITDPPRPAIDVDIIADTSLLMGHRLSETTIDRELAKTLKILYSDYDGYIQEYRIGSCWMNAFPPEVCLFDATTCDLEVMTQQTGGRKARNKVSQQKAGVENDVWYHKMNDTMWKPGEYLTQTNALNRLLLRYDGFSNEEIDKLKDSDGFIIMPDNAKRSKKRYSDFRVPITEKEVRKIGKDLPQGKITLSLNRYNGIHKNETM
jgi:hypothetical protein